MSESVKVETTTGAVSSVDLAEIVEVQSTGTRQVNEWLDAGYKLLALGPTTTERALQNGTTFVLRAMTCVVGRTADVPHHEKVETPK